MTLGLLFSKTNAKLRKLLMDPEKNQYDHQNCDTLELALVNVLSKQILFSR